MSSQRRTVLLVVAAAAAVLATGLVVSLVLVSGGRSKPTAVTTGARSALLAGIPQDGIVLGDPSAPELGEFVDFQCPYCAEVSRLVVPTVVREYVRTGKVKLVFHGLAFIGPDSLKALRAAESAGLQNRLWDVAEALFARQGGENAGWVTDALLREAGAGVAGLDVARWLAETDSAAVTNRIAEASARASSAGIQSTPTFVFGGRQLRLASLDPAAFRAALDPLLAE